MANSLFPGFIIVHYTVSGHNHRQTLPVKPFQDIGGEWEVERVDGAPGGSVWTAAIQGWVDEIDQVFSDSATVFSSAELFTMESPTADPIFRESYAFPDITGSGTGANLLSETVYTFRTEAGGIMKIYLMETVFTDDERFAPPTWGGATRASVANFLLADDSFIFGRDGTRPIAGIHFTTKENDALRKKFVLET